MILHDTIEISDVMTPRLTKDGYLTAQVRVARTGIQMYLAKELGLDGDPNRVVKVYRPPEEVFANDAMASYAYRPVTVNHPDTLVDAENWKAHARGQTGGEILRDKEFVQVPMVLMDSGAIDEWKAGKRQLSMGYTMDLDTTSGTTPGGEQYDAVQRNLRMNHLAIVAQARGGSELKLGDEEPVMSEIKLTTITVDGLSVETTDAGAQAIGKLTKELADAKAETKKSTDDHAAALKVKDTELAAKDAEITKLKESQVTAEDMDKLVKDRADLTAKAKSIADVDYSGQSVDEIRKAAVVAKLGADAVKDKSADYIAARFDILAEDAAKDPVRKAMQSGPAPKAGTRDAAYNEYVSDISNAWKGEQKEAH